jgi:hypothetical protein
MFAIITEMRITANNASLLYHSFVRLSDLQIGVAHSNTLSLHPFVLLLRVVLKIKMSMLHCWADYDS